jgi:hypothetical protein
MKYFLIDCLGNYRNEDYCFTDKGPKGVMDGYDLLVGTRVADEYPDGLGETTLKLGEDYPGLELTSFIGNTSTMLIVKHETATFIQTFDVGEIEVIPFTLINHKGRVHSRDYVFVNPLGSVDCLDMNKTEKKLHDDGSIMKITKFVLAASKLAGVRHLFRLKEDLTQYVFSEALVTALRERGCTNFVFEELEQS